MMVAIVQITYSVLSTVEMPGNPRRHMTPATRGTGKQRGVRAYA